MYQFWPPSVVYGGEAVVFIEETELPKSVLGQSSSICNDAYVCPGIWTLAPQRHSVFSQSCHGGSKSAIVALVPLQALSFPEIIVGMLTNEIGFIVHRVEPGSLRCVSRSLRNESGSFTKRPVTDLGRQKPATTEIFGWPFDPGNYFVISV